MVVPLEWYSFGGIDSKSWACGVIGLRRKALDKDEVTKQHPWKHSEQ